MRGIFRVLTTIAGAIGVIVLLLALFIFFAFLFTDHSVTLPDGRLESEPTVAGIPRSLYPAVVVACGSVPFFAVCAFFFIAVKAHDIELHAKSVSESSSGMLFELQKERRAEEAKIKAARQIEQDRLDAERQRKTEEQQAAERARKEADRAKHDAEKQAARLERERKKAEERNAKILYERSHFTCLCPHCQRSLEVPKAYADKTAKCPGCGQQITLSDSQGTAVLT